jgi:hypothetical protein
VAVYLFAVSMVGTCCGAAVWLALKREREYKIQVQATPRGCSEAQGVAKAQRGSLVYRWPDLSASVASKRWRLLVITCLRLSS